MPETPEGRREVEELLPFYVNGSLGSAERARVEAALAEDAELRLEADFLGRVRGSVKTSAQDQGVGALGERRLLRTIHRDARREQVRRFARPALALAAGLALVAQTLVIANLMRDDAGLDTLTGPAATLQVRFESEARESEIRELLLEQGLVIVDGPSALGLYHLALEDPAEADRIVELLRSRPDLVEHVAKE